MVVVAAGLAGCTSQASEGPGAVTPDGVHAKLDTPQGSMQAIIAQLLPRNRAAAKLLHPITNTAFLEGYEGAPEGRVAADEALFELDVRFQNEVTKLVKEGVIRRNSLVLDDTGHSIPNLARVLQDPSLGLVGTVCLPWNTVQPVRLALFSPRDPELAMLIETSRKSLVDQAQTFGDRIAVGQRAMETRRATGLYVAIDGMRPIELRTGTWPGALDFLLFGVTNAVVLVERAQTWRTGGEMAQDLMEYVTRLREDGLPVRVVGMDVRVAQSR